MLTALTRFKLKVACFCRSTTLLRAQPGVCLQTVSVPVHVHGQPTPGGCLCVSVTVSPTSCHLFAYSEYTCCVPAFVCVCACRELFCCTNSRRFLTFFVVFFLCFHVSGKALGAHS